MTPASMFSTPNALTDLSARTEYEAWFLEAVYEIAERRIATNDPDELIYPPNGGPPRSVKYASSHIRIGDWRGEFLKVGGPLVFVTAFKILDMVIEWVLVGNGVASTHKFAEKTKVLRGSVQFPSLVGTRPWLRERLCALYKQLEPLRGTIIHDRHFTSASGSLGVSSTKGGRTGPVVSITERDLRNLTLVLVSVVRCLQGTWVMDTFEEKRLRRALDELAHLHKLPVLGQLPPHRLKVRVYVLDGDPITFDITKVRTDVAAKYEEVDTIFDALIIAVARDGAGAKAYLLPWDQLQQAGTIFQESRVALGGRESTLPSDVNIADAARELNEKAGNTSDDCQ